MTITKGEAITKASETEGPYPVILGGQEPAYYINRYNHEGKAIVISRSGASAGYASFWNEPIFVTDGFLIEPLNNNHIEYIFYLLKYFGKALHDLQNGSAIPHVTPKTIYSLKAPIPPESVQNKIAETLSTYDNLIEVNNKRIKLLEQMAENLYKEWFVRFRFPGHETTEFENGIPKGWKIQKLKDIAEVGRGSSPRPIIDQQYFEGGTIPWIKIADATSSKIYIYSTKEYVNEFGASFSRKLPAGSLILAASGTLGFPMFLAVEGCIHDGWMYFSRFHGVPSIYVYYVLMNLRKTFANASYGAAIQNINTEIVRKSNIIIPDKKTLENFQTKAEDIHRTIITLQKQNNNLIKQRDLLLPRLMSGKLEI